MSTSLICRWTSTRTQASHTVFVVSATRKRCAATTSSSATTAVAIRRRKNGCEWRNFRWFWLYTWNASNTWSSTIDTLRCRIVWFFHSNYDCLIRLVLIHIFQLLKKILIFFSSPVGWCSQSRSSVWSDGRCHSLRFRSESRSLHKHRQEPRILASLRWWHGWCKT